MPPSTPPAEPPDLHAANLSSIFASWSNDREAETNGPECRKAVQLVLAMYRSAEHGGAPVAVDSV